MSGGGLVARAGRHLPTRGVSNRASALNDCDNDKLKLALLQSITLVNRGKAPAAEDVGSVIKLAAALCRCDLVRRNSYHD